MAVFICGNGLVFDAKVIDPAVEYLKANPDQVEAFTKAMLGNLEGLLGWNMLATAREGFEALCQVLEAVRGDQPVDVAGQQTLTVEDPAGD